jgi:hypothetical protein
MDSADFPSAFQWVIVYHNICKFNHQQLVSDIWTNPTESFTPNEEEIYIKMEFDPEAEKKEK